MDLGARLSRRGSLVSRAGRASGAWAPYPRPHAPHFLPKRSGFGRPSGLPGWPGRDRPRGVRVDGGMRCWPWGGGPRRPGFAMVLTPTPVPGSRRWPVRGLSGWLPAIACRLALCVLLLADQCHGALQVFEGGLTVASRGLQGLVTRQCGDRRETDPGVDEVLAEAVTVMPRAA